MAANYPGPYELRIFYTTMELTHVQKLNIDFDSPPSPGDLFSSMDVVTIANQLPTLETYVDAYAALVAALLDDGVSTIDRAELWEYEPLSYDATFISAYDIAIAGTDEVQTIKQAGEYILTFRTTEGGIMRMHFLEMTEGKGPSKTYAELPTPYQDIVDFVLGDGGGFLARDTSFPIAFIKGHPGENEAIFRKRWR